MTTRSIDNEDYSENKMRAAISSINIKSFGLAFGATGVLLYLGCMLLMLILGHNGTVAFFNSILHGFDTSSILRMNVPILESLIGLVETFVLGYLVGACIAGVYNFSSK
jgi:hypothetical protein